MPHKDMWIWDSAPEGSYWLEKVKWSYDSVGDLERQMKTFRDEKFQRVSYDNVVYWDGGTEIKSIQLLQKVLEEEGKEGRDKVINVWFAEAKWEPMYDWKARW